LICPNCGRRNSAGATFCSRCHQRLPLVNKIDTTRRRAVMVEPRGGGGSTAVVLAVALVAGFLFIGGAAAIYLSNPAGAADPTDIAFASGTPTLPPFVQPTATPSPSPTFILLPSESPLFSPLPTASIVGPTAQPTPIASSNPPTPVPVVARFKCSQQGTNLSIKCQENSKGNVTAWHWDFGDGLTSDDRNPTHPYDSYGKKSVTLTVTGPNGDSDALTKDVILKEATPSPPPTIEPTPPPVATATPCAPELGTPCPNV
jgi:hypothetical protein